MWGMFEDVAGYVSPYLRWLLDYLYDDFYVAQSGDDTNSGTSWDKPWGSVEKATTDLKDGKRLHIEYGTYNEALTSLDFQNVGRGGIEIIISDTSDTPISGNEVIINFS